MVSMVYIDTVNGAIEREIAKGIPNSFTAYHDRNPTRAPGLAKPEQ